jgi:hypothetical protein
MVVCNEFFEASGTEPPFLAPSCAVVLLRLGAVVDLEFGEDVAYGRGRAELDGDHDRARDDTGTRGDASALAPGSAAQDVGEIARDEYDEGGACHGTKAAADGSRHLFPSAL